jgi:hypothetical protein
MPRTSESGRQEWDFEMLQRLAMIASVVALALLLNGCTKCGPIWDDWFPSQKSCKSDHL